MDHSRRPSWQDTSRSGESSSSQHRDVEHYRREGTRFQPTAIVQVKAEVQKRYGLAWVDHPPFIEAVLRSMDPDLQRLYHEEQAQMRSVEQAAPHNDPRIGAPRLVSQTSRGEEASQRQTRSRRSECPPTSYHFTPPSRPKTAFRPAGYSTNEQSPNRPATASGHRSQRAQDLPKFSRDIFNPASTGGPSFPNFDHRQPPQSRRTPNLGDRPPINEDDSELELLSKDFSRSTSISDSYRSLDASGSPSQDKSKRHASPQFPLSPAKWGTPHDSRVNMPSTSSYSTKDVNQVSDPSQPSSLHRDTRHKIHEVNEQNFVDEVCRKVGVRVLRDYARQNTGSTANKNTKKVCKELLKACNDFLYTQKYSSPDLRAIDCALRIRDALNELDLRPTSKVLGEREAINRLYEEYKTK